MIARFMPRSSRGLGRRPLTAVTRVRIPYGVRRESSSGIFREGFPYFHKMRWLGPAVGDSHLLVLPTGARPPLTSSRLDSSEQDAFSVRGETS